MWFQNPTVKPSRSSESITCLITRLVSDRISISLCFVPMYTSPILFLLFNSLNALTGMIITLGKEESDLSLLFLTDGETEAQGGTMNLRHTS